MSSSPSGHLNTFHVLSTNGNKIPCGLKSGSAWAMSVPGRLLYGPMQSSFGPVYVSGDGSHVQ